MILWPILGQSPRFSRYLLQPIGRERSKGEREAEVGSRSIPVELNVRPLILSRPPASRSVGMNIMIALISHSDDFSRTTAEGQLCASLPSEFNNITRGVFFVFSGWGVIRQEVSFVDFLTPVIRFRYYSAPDVQIAMSEALGEASQHDADTLPALTITIGLAEMSDHAITPCPYNGPSVVRAGWWQSKLDNNPMPYSSSLKDGGLAGSGPGGLAVPLAWYVTVVLHTPHRNMLMLPSFT
ncbi:hypothetical protein BKA82DRAFT_4179094 [Pisolithus tinctorius]|nr:hypothetical protein BKA82DRAFT_4179094 [Pisolithus tinctorius]